MTGPDLEPADVCTDAPTRAAEQSGGFSLGREALRLVLIRRARAGIFDTRFFAYWGVDSRVNRGCRRAARRAYAALLVPTSTRRFPVTLTGSYHTRREPDGDGQAIDLGNTRRRVWPNPEGVRRTTRYQRAEFRAWRAGRRPNMIELIGPDNSATVLRGVHSPLQADSPLAAQHRNHVHQAFRK